MTGIYNEPFDDCDVFVPRLEGHDPAVTDVFANGKGQKAVQALFPDLLIAWRLPESLCAVGLAVGQVERPQDGRAF